MEVNANNLNDETAGTMKFKPIKEEPSDARDWKCPVYLNLQKEARELSVSETFLNVKEEVSCTNASVDFQGDLAGMPIKSESSNIEDVNLKPPMEGKLNVISEFSRTVCGIKEETTPDCEKPAPRQCSAGHPQLGNSSTCKLCAFRSAIKRSLGEKSAPRRCPSGHPQFENSSTCKLCAFRSAVSRSLKQNKFMNDEPHGCRICGKKFADWFGLQQHMAKCHEKPLECSICDYKTADAARMQQHLKEHTGHKLLECRICGQQVVDAPSLKQHMQQHGEKPYQCKICRYRAKENFILQQHLKAHNSKELLTRETFGHGDASVSNLQKYMVFNLNQHMQHHGEKPYQCKICGYRTKESSLLQQHLKAHASKESLTCEICGHKDTSISNLQEHMVLHTGATIYKCNDCDYETMQKVHLQIHSRKHTRKKSFKCKICGYRSVYRHSISRHIKRHMKAKWLQCYICKMLCTARSKLEKHMQKHTVSSFKCKLCSNSYSRIYGLRKHMEKYHASELIEQKIKSVQEPVMCKACGFKTVRASYLQKNSDNKPYECAICGFGTAATAKVRLHRKSHDKIRKHVTSEINAMKS